jgi:anti-sigma factor ChrR (cupin superfamily)
VLAEGSRCSQRGVETGGAFELNSERETKGKRVGEAGQTVQPARVLKTAKATIARWRGQGGFAEPIGR